MQNNKRAEECREEGIHLMREFKIDEAIVKFTEGLIHQSNNAKLYLERAEAYYCLEAFDKALVDCEIGVNFDDTISESYFLWSKTLRALGEYEKSTEIIMGGNALFPHLHKLFADYQHVTAREQHEASLVAVTTRDMTSDIKLRLLSNLIDNVNSVTMEAHTDVICCHLTNFITVVDDARISSGSDALAYCEIERRICLFKLKNGYKLVHTHPLLNQWFFTDSAKYEDYLCLILELFTITSIYSEPNMLLIYKDAIIMQRLVAIVESRKDIGSVFHAITLLRTIMNRDEYQPADHPLAVIDANVVVKAVLRMYNDNVRNKTCSDLLLKLFACPKLVLNLTTSFVTFLSASDIKADYLDLIEKLTTHRDEDNMIYLMTCLMMNARFVKVLAQSENIWKSLLLRLNCKDNPMIIELISFMSSPATRFRHHVAEVVGMTTPHISRTVFTFDVTHSVNLINKCIMVRDSRYSPDRKLVNLIVGTHKKFNEYECLASACQQFYCTVAVMYPQQKNLLILCGGLPQIVQGVLKKENHEMVGNAASTLVKMLPLLPYIATFLVNTDAMAVLVEAMIGAEDQTVRLTCAKLIVKLITANDLHREKVYALGGLDVLLQFVKSNDISV